jgi:hypothetical protein
MRLGLFIVIALAFTLAWWTIASQALHAGDAVLYFVIPVAGNLLLAWGMGLWRKSSSVARTFGTSGLSIGVVVLAFFLMAIVAGWKSGTFGAQNSPSDGYRIVERN